MEPDILPTPMELDILPTPVGNDMRHNVHPSPGANSLMCVTYFHDQENDRNEETSSAAKLVTLHLFPLKPDLEEFSNIQRLADQVPEIFAGNISTELKLFNDPFHFRKTLKQSDINPQQSRLLMGRHRHLVGWISKDVMKQAESEDGAGVMVWDMEYSSPHRVMFGFWKLAGAYVLKGGWIKEFVQRKGLRVGDEIGMYWDRTKEGFQFCMLRKA